MTHGHEIPCLATLIPSRPLCGPGASPGLGPGWPRTPCALHRSCRQPRDEAALDTRTAAQDMSVGADALGCGPTLGVLGEENEEGWAAMLLAVLIKKRHSSPIPPYPTLPGRVHSHAGEFAEGSLPPWSASSRVPRRRPEVPAPITVGLRLSMPDLPPHRTSSTGTFAGTFAGPFPLPAPRQLQPGLLHTAGLG